jgi:tRNA U34 5-methylaminomethyl-2-thiouridine-forming methyltransferase MnmC
MDHLQIITTSDGSHSVRNTDLDETYHSVHGAVQESMHVFITNGLEYFTFNRRASNASILEIGFGTGLNALLTWRYGRQNSLQIRYTSLEPFPLPREVWSKLNYDIGRAGGDLNILHKSDWNSEILLAPGFTLQKISKQLQDVALTDQYDVIFFDAFAPGVQPELWVYESLKKVITPLRAGGVFVTYSAKGQLKRDLKALGLHVETLAGPPGKNEMVRGVKI